MASREVRRLVYARLPLWADYLRHGYLPGQGDGIPSGNRPGSRLPCPDWLLDLSRAFAALNPATSGLAESGNLAWLVHVPFTAQQSTVWLYYSPDFAPDAVQTRSADATQWAHQREHELRRAIKAHDSKRDALVAQHLHLATWKARRLRSEAVWTMADLVQWEEEMAA